MLRMFGIGNDEAYYAHAAAEIADGQVRPGLWAKALAETGYDDKLARARYLKLRVRTMKAEVAEGRRLVREQERAMEQQPAPRRFYRVLGYDLWFDLTLGFGLWAINPGGSDGELFIAAAAVIIVGIVLRALRWLMGYERYSLARRQWEYYST